ncbi:MAG: lipopolysaccharide kinase InaA family protein [Thermodesulfobacteriota bacterium]
MSEKPIEYRHNGYKGFVCRGYDSATFLEYLNNIDENIAEVVRSHYKDFDKQTDRMVTAIEVPFADSTRKFLLKQDDFTRAFNAQKMTKYAFKPSRGRRGFDASLLMMEKGLLIPEPVAYIEKRKMGAFLKGFFFMEFIDQAKSLRDVLTGDACDKGALMAEVGTTIKRLHDIGCTHGDMKATNFLVRDDGEQRRLYMIDSEDVRCHSKIPRKRRLDDLVRFYESSGDSEGNFIRPFLSGYGKDINIVKENISARELRGRLSIPDSAAG